MKIFFDLDGTLIDSKKRLYNLFCDLVQENDLSYDEYWNLKMNKVSNYDILKDKYNYSSDKVENFRSIWMSKIEQRKYLKYDIPIPGVGNFLRSLSNKHDLYVVTARQNKEGVLWQFNRFGWMNFFKNVLVTEQKRTKIQLIIEKVEQNEEIMVVGDTGKDIICGKSFDAKTVAVLTGFLNYQNLVEYKPDVIVDSVLDIKI